MCSRTLGNWYYYNLLKEAGITWKKKLTHSNPAKNNELVKAKKKLGRKY